MERGIRRSILFLVLIPFLWINETLSAESNIFSISESQLIELSKDIAPKVALFREIWKQNPNAVLFAGTSRDFIYWILRKIGKPQNQSELDCKISELKKLEWIDIREIVGPESDIDIISDKPIDISAERFGIRKLDIISGDRLDLSQEIGRSELDQGYIPAEKILLRQNGLDTLQHFADGIEDILTGKIRVFFPPEEKFWTSFYAKQGLNHPSLLAVRYLRILAADWNFRYGNNYPDPKKLLNFDPAIKNKIINIFKSSRDDPKLHQMLTHPKGRSWYNGAILKSFRSYTNPTAAHILLSELGFNELILSHPEMETINQFLFIKSQNPSELKMHFLEFGYSEDAILRSPGEIIQDLRIFHGTREEIFYRAIIYLNALPSMSGSMGSGLYGADFAHLSIAHSFAGTPDRIVEFSVSPSARLIDITEGEGKELYFSWIEKYGDNPDQFADYFGIDIVKYDYRPYAFLIKNSAVITGRRGFRRQLITSSEAAARATTIKSYVEYKKFLELLRFNAFSSDELQMIFAKTDPHLEHRFLKKLWHDPDLSSGRYSVAFSIHSYFGELKEKFSKLTSANSFIEKWEMISENLSDRQKQDLISSIPLKNIMQIIVNMPPRKYSHEGFFYIMDSLKMPSIIELVSTRPTLLEDPYNIELWLNNIGDHSKEEFNQLVEMLFHRGHGGLNILFKLLNSKHITQKPDQNSRSWFYRILYNGFFINQPWIDSDFVRNHYIYRFGVFDYVDRNLSTLESIIGAIIDRGHSDNEILSLERAPITFYDQETYSWNHWMAFPKSPDWIAIFLKRGLGKKILDYLFLKPPVISDEIKIKILNVLENNRKLLKRNERPLIQRARRALRIARPDIPNSEDSNECHHILNSSVLK